MTHVYFIKVLEGSDIRPWKWLLGCENDFWSKRSDFLLWSDFWNLKVTSGWLKRSDFWDWLYAWLIALFLGLSVVRARETCRFALYWGNYSISHHFALLGLSTEIFTMKVTLVILTILTFCRVRTPEILRNYIKDFCSLIVHQLVEC